MKSKKDILDKYEQGEFVNYKNGSPPKPNPSNIEFRGSPETLAHINQVVSNTKRDEAVAFANWILKHDAYPITDDQWLVARGEDPVTREEVYTYSTTEELYQEFLKSA